MHHLSQGSKRLASEICIYTDNVVTLEVLE